MAVYRSEVTYLNPLKVYKKVWVHYNDGTSTVLVQDANVTKNTKDPKVLLVSKDPIILKWSGNLADTPTILILSYAREEDILPFLTYLVKDSVNFDSRSTFPVDAIYYGTDIAQALALFPVPRYVCLLETLEAPNIFMEMPSEVMNYVAFRKCVLTFLEEMLTVYHRHSAKQMVKHTIKEKLDASNS